MSLLDELLGGLAGQPAGRDAAPRAGAAGGDMSRVLMALLPVVLGMLANRGGAGTGQGGGLEDLLGQVLGGGAGSGRGGGRGLEDLLGQVLGGGARSGPAAGGGLGDLLDAFQRAGYGEQSRSWVGTGRNEPIPPDAVGQVFGHDALSQIAARAGLTEQETSEGLSQLLPEVVDKVTPAGQLPDFEALAASVNEMARRMR